MTRLTKNVLYNVAGQGAVLALSLIAFRFIFRQLGDDIFGIIFFNLLLTSLLSNALDLGVSATIVREVSRHFDSDRTYVGDLIQTASALYWAMGLILIAMIWFASPLIVTHWLNLKAISPDAAATLLRILGVTTLVALPKTLYASLFRGRQLMGLNNAIDLGAALVQQGGILLLLLANKSAYAVAVWIALSVTLGLIAYVLVAGRLFGWSVLIPSVSTHVVRRNFQFTRSMMLISALSLIHTQTAQVLVSKLLPIAQFGFYGLASSTVNRTAFVTGAVSQAAFPSFSVLVASDSRPDLLVQYRKLHELVSYGTLPLFVGICFVAIPAYTYVFNPAVAQLLLLPTAFLALGTWMNTTMNIPYTLSLAMGKPGIAARLNLYALVLVLPVTAGLTYAFGLRGASFSLVFYNLFAYAYLIPRVCRECLDIPAAGWYLQVVKILALGALTYGPAWLFVSVIAGLSRFPIDLFAYAAGTMAFGAGAYMMIGPDLKRTIQRLPNTLVTRDPGTVRNA